jgi:hypothetical protein
MDSLWYLLVCLAVAVVVFWEVPNDRRSPDEMKGPFAMRRLRDSRIAERSKRRFPGIR